MMGTTDQELLDLFRSGLRDVVPGNKSWDHVTLDTTMDDLAIDSVMFMELVGYIEDETGKTFPDDALAQLATLRDLARLVQES